MADDALNDDVLANPNVFGTIPTRPTPVTGLSTDAGITDIAKPAASTPPTDPPPPPDPAKTDPATPPAAPAKSAADELTDVAVERGKAAIKRDEEAAKRTEEEVKEYVESRKRQTEAEDAERKIRAANASEQLDVLHERQKIRENRPEMQLPPPPPQQHYTMPPGLFGNNNSPGNGLANAMSVLGGIGPGGLQMNNIIAIKALTGALDGWHAGEKEKFDLEMKNYESQYRYIKDVNTTLRQRYQDTLDDNTLSLEEKKAKLELEGMQYKDVIAVETARRGDLKTFDDLMNARDKQLDAADKHLEDLIKTVDAHDKATHGGGKAGGLSAEAQDSMAASLLKGDYGGMADLTPTQRAGVVNAAIIKGHQMGLTDDQINAKLGDARVANVGKTALTRAEMATAGRMDTQVSQAVQELKNFIPRTVTSVRALNASDWVVVNKLYQMGQKYSSNPKYQAALVDLFGLENAYVRAMNPRGNPRVADAARLDAKSILDVSVGPKGLEAQMQEMWFEANNSLKAIRQVRSGELSFDDAFPDPGGATPTGATPGAPVAPPPHDIDILKSNPSEARKRVFDKHYGEGAADRVLFGGP